MLDTYYVHFNKKLPQKFSSLRANALDFTTLFERRQILNNRLFKEIVEDSFHKLNNLLPSRNSCTANLRKRRMFQLPICKTNRFKNTFIPYNLYNSIN